MSQDLPGLLSKLKSEPELPHLKRAIALMENAAWELSAPSPSPVLVSEALEFWTIRQQHSRRIKMAIYGLYSFLQHLKSRPATEKLDSYAGVKDDAIITIFLDAQFEAFVGLLLFDKTGKATVGLDDPTVD